MPTFNNFIMFFITRFVKKNKISVTKQEINVINLFSFKGLYKC